MLGGIEGTSFISEGELCIATIYIGFGEGPRPTVLLLHGLPGFEKNIDIAYELREIGWNVMIPHYRGCWGSEGKYRFTGIPTDVKNAISLMETKSYVDKDKIFLVGHSMGAWATIITTAQDKRVKGAVAIAGGSTSSEVPDRIKVYLDSVIKQKFLKGITVEEAIEDWVKMGQELAAQDWIGKISPRPLLLIGGSKDATVTPESVKEVYAKAKKPTELEIIEEADHVFTRHRKKLVKKVTGWLQSKI